MTMWRIYKTPAGYRVALDNVPLPGAHATWDEALAWTLRADVDQLPANARALIEA